MSTRCGNRTEISSGNLQRRAFGKKSGPERNKKMGPNPYSKKGRVGNYPVIAERNPPSGMSMADKIEEQKITDGTGIAYRYLGEG